MIHVPSSNGFSMVFQMKNTDALENDIGVLRNTCDRMADEVTKITQGAGEDKVEDTFYHSRIHVKFLQKGVFICYIWINRI